MAAISLPTPGVTPGPSWASSLNAAITAVNADVERRELSMYPAGFTSTHWYGSPAPATVSTGALTLNMMYATPIFVTKPCAISKIAVEVTTLAASSLLRLGVYQNVLSVPNGLNMPDYLLFDAGTISGATTGVKEIDVSASSHTFPTAGLYWLTCVAQTAAPTVRTITGHQPPVSRNTFDGASLLTAYTKTGITGALNARWGDGGGAGESVGTVAPRIMIQAGLAL